jgi:hypothetical protein
MKTKLFILITVLITTLAFTMTVNAGQRDRGNKGKRDQGYQQDQGRDRGYNQDRNRGHGRYHKPPRWKKHHGQRRHVPNYHRHRQWRRWNDWDHHYRQHPRRYPDGRYHYDRQGNLNFSYCEPDSGNCFSFGIYF